MQDDAARTLVADCCRILEANGHSDYIWGHVSLRATRERGFWMKPAGLSFAEVGPDDVLLVGFDGEVLEGDRPRHSEWPIHAAVLASNPKVNSVIHSHPPYAIALGATRASLLPLSHAGTLFVPPAPLRFTATANLITDLDQGAAVAEVLGSSPVALMVNHGIVAAGDSVEEACVRAILFEKACAQQIIAMSMGERLDAPGDTESLEKRETVWPQARIQSLWDYLYRTLPQQ